MRVLTLRLERKSLVETRLFLELLELKRAFKNPSKDDLNDDDDNDAGGESKNTKFQMGTESRPTLYRTRNLQKCGVKTKHTN